MKELSIQTDFYNKTKTYSTVQTKQRVSSSNVLQRVAKGDRIAIKECIDNYGDRIWSMAKKFTDSTEDAEAVTQEIFLNIWHYAARFEQTNFDELLFITIVARRQLSKYSEKSNHSITKHSVSFTDKGTSKGEVKSDSRFT
jgi:DNA-directed RNA polymerase specialized sigma24 family protein